MLYIFTCYITIGLIVNEKHKSYKIIEFYINICSLRFSTNAPTARQYSTKTIFEFFEINCYNNNNQTAQNEKIKNTLLNSKAKQRTI